MEQDARARPKATSIRPLRALLPFVVRYPLMLCQAVFWLGLATLATLSLPVAVRYMIDEGFSAPTPDAIDTYFLGLLGVAVVLGIASAMRFYCVTWLGERVANDLRYAVYQHLLKLDMYFFERTRTGELVARLTADTTLIRTILDTSVSVALRNGLLFIGASIMLVSTSPSLSFYAVLAIPLVVVPLWLMGRLVRTRARVSQAKLADASALITESIPAMGLVQAFTNEKNNLARFDASLKASFLAAKARIASRGWLTAIAIIMVFAGIVLTLWLGAQQLLAGTISAGVLGQFVLYALFAASGMGVLAEVWGDVQLAAGATERLSEILATTPAIASVANARALPNPVRGNIAFEGVSFAYPSRPQVQAVQGISLAIGAGKSCALVGESGAGKSTLFQLLLRFYDVSQGRILLDDAPINQLAPEALRSAIAVVPQETVLFAGSVRDNILFGRPTASQAELEQAAKAALADEFIRALPNGYDSLLGERGVNLSGGQRQRLAIARALLRDAPILLLDEATNALDAQSEALVQQALKTLMAGRTSLVIAHRLATVRDAEQIVMLQQGRIIAQGTHEKLLAESSAYQELVRLQFSDSTPSAA